MNGYEELTEDQIDQMVNDLSIVETEEQIPDPCLEGCQVVDPSAEIETGTTDHDPPRAPAQALEPAGPLAKIELTGEEYKDIINSLNTLVTECRVHIHTYGITIRAVDNANVAMVDMVLPKTYFTYYQVTEPAEIGIDVAKLKKSVTMFQKKDIVSITVRDHKKMVIEGSGSVLTLTNLDPNTIRKDPNPPNIDLKVIGTLPAGQFTATMKDAAKFSDKIALNATNDHITFRAEGDCDLFNRSYQWAPLKNGIGPEGARSLFSLDYLKDIAGSFNKKEEIRIDMGTDHPIRLTREGINGVPGSRIEFLLAPRIESD